MDDAGLRARMREGRLEQITEHIDQIEHDLAEVQELVARMRDDNSEAASIPDMQLSGNRQVTSACWTCAPVRVQEDSASL
jgi:hypothetical protein